MSAPEILRIYETVVYGADLDAMVAFYADALGLRLVDGPDGSSAALRVPDGGVLLIFDPSRSSAAGRVAPSHGTSGAAHVAFAVTANTLELWRTRLEEHAVEIERQVTWEQGARSLYVRDPAGNSVELTEDELWPA